MLLTAVQFAEIINSLAERAVDVRPNERRRAPRVVHRTWTSIIPGDDPSASSPTTVMVKDLSSRGLRLVHSKPFARGSNFIVRLMRPEAQPTTILCTVCHCTEMDNHMFSIGAEFTCVLGDKAKSTPPQDSKAQERIRDSMLSW